MRREEEEKRKTERVERNLFQQQNGVRVDVGTHSLLVFGVKNPMQEELDERNDTKSKQPIPNTTQEKAN